MINLTMYNLAQHHSFYHESIIIEGSNTAAVSRHNLRKHRTSWLSCELTVAELLHVVVEHRLLQGALVVGADGFPVAIR